LLVGILFPHINDDARSKPHQNIYFHYKKHIVNTVWWNNFYWLWESYESLSLRMWEKLTVIYH